MEKMFENCENALHGLYCMSPLTTKAYSDRFVAKYDHG